MSKKHFQFKDLQTRQTRSHKFTTAFLLSKDDELLLIGVHYFWQKQNKQGKKNIQTDNMPFFLQPEIRKCWCSWVAFLNESCNAQVQPSVISLISSVLDNFVHPPAFYPFVVPCKCFGLGIEYTRWERRDPRRLCLLLRGCYCHTLRCTGIQEMIAFEHVALLASKSFHYLKLKKRASQHVKGNVWNKSH